MIINLESERISSELLNGYHRNMQVHATPAPRPNTQSDIIPGMAALVLRALLRATMPGRPKGLPQ